MASPINTTTIGNHGRLILLNGPYSTAIPAKIYDFEWERMEEKVHRAYISGERDKFSFPNGYSGSFNVDRTDDVLENAFTDADKAMDADGTYDNWELTFKIVIPGGGSQTLAFHGCACTLSKGGSYKQNGVVTLTIHFEASSMNYVNNPGGQ